MKPWELLGKATAPDGTVIKLTRRDDEYVILADEKSLMSSRMHGSEDALATVALKEYTTLKRPCVLIGGLGMGFTLRAALDVLPQGASVIVAEMLREVIEWNRGPLGQLAAAPMADSRVHVEIADVAAMVRAACDRFDAILLDVDNSPSEFTVKGNSHIYDDRGIASIRAALRPNGTLAVWSAHDDPKFIQRLRHAGFSVQAEHVRSRQKQGGSHHTIFLGYKRPHS